MLELKKITKIYDTGSYKQKALNEVSLSFQKGEIVSILGASGSGKTTLLNIIGGLDRYTSGDLIINGKSTKDFKDVDWDSYRNNSIGFVFQSYNLINHISVLDNVELSLTLSGVGSHEKRTKAKAALEKVGLSEHLHKRPNQLSGGQKQRVAIARALVNDPDIILLDEPTGALDSRTSMLILDLISEIAKDRLIIMVTHNADLATKYSTRIIQLKDGNIISDSKPQVDTPDKLEYRPKKTSMSFFTALKLSFNNLRTKLLRSLITSFAASIGIIGVALVLSIANGFTKEVERLERESLSGMPITIEQNPFDLSSFQNIRSNNPKEPAGDYIVPYDPTEIIQLLQHQNIITQEFIDFLEANDEYYETLTYSYDIVSQMGTTLSNPMFNLLYKYDDKIAPLNASDISFTPLPLNHDYILEQFKVLSGRMPQNAHEVVLVTDNYHRINQSILMALGVEITDQVAYDKVIDKIFVSARNNDYYEVVNNLYKKKNDLQTAYDNGFELKIVGIIKANNDVAPLLLGQGIAYDNRFLDLFLEDSLNSDIVLAQKDADYDVQTGFPINDKIPGQSKSDLLAKIGGTKIPTSISIYVKDFESKEKLKDKLDEYNEGKAEEAQIKYSDLAESFTNIMSTLIDGISIVLLAFAGISLVVSSIMIGIITYVSVLERTKEIGVLRSLGARKKDVARVFNAETFIIGLVAGILGIIISLILTIPINMVLTNAVNGMMHNIARLSVFHIIVLIIISVMLTLISGLIPALIAAKKDPVEALRVEG